MQLSCISIVATMQRRKSMKTIACLAVAAVTVLCTSTATAEGVHGDLYGGVLGEFNGLLMPKGGAEAGVGIFVHGGIHPAGPLTLSLGVDGTTKGEGNWGWGVHVGIGVAAELKSVSLGIELLLGYHGERRTIDLSGVVFKTPMLHHGFVLGLGPELAINLTKFSNGSVFQLFLKPEVALVFSPAHAVPEWLLSPLIGLGGELYRAGRVLAPLLYLKIFFSYFRCIVTMCICVQYLFCFF
jgi:hypothetical protein